MRRSCRFLPKSCGGFRLFIKMWFDDVRLMAIFHSLDGRRRIYNRPFHASGITCHINNWTLLSSQFRVHRNTLLIQVVINKLKTNRSSLRRGSITPHQRPSSEFWTDQSASTGLPFGIDTIWWIFSFSTFRIHPLARQQFRYSRRIPLTACNFLVPHLSPTLTQYSHLVRFIYSARRSLCKRWKRNERKLRPKCACVSLCHYIPPSIVSLARFYFPIALS